MSMSLPKRQQAFVESEEGISAYETLLVMASDKTYNTNASYSANISNYPDNRIPFVDKHMNYLMAHPDIKPSEYLANLRLMTRVR